MRDPMAFVFSPGDSREATAAWIQPYLNQALEMLPDIMSSAGIKTRILQPGLVQTQAEAVRLARLVEYEMQEGDILVPLCIGWGLPGISSTLLSYLDGSLRHGHLKLLLLSNLLEQYPGYVQAAAIAQFANERLYHYQREIVTDWADKTVADHLTQFRETGKISRPWDTHPPKICIDHTEDDLGAVNQVVQRLRGNIYAPVGGSSMLMRQGYAPLSLLADIGIGLQDIGMGELRAAMDRIPNWRAEAAMKFCLSNGLKNINVEENQFRRQMQLLLALYALRDHYGFTFGGIQGQFDLTSIDVADDFATALMNSRCRPESNGKAMVWATENDAWGALTMLIMQLSVEARYGVADDSVGFHDLRHIAPDYTNPAGSPGIVLLNSGALNLRDLTGCNDTMAGVRLESQDPGYFPNGGGCSAGEMVPTSKITYPGHVPDEAKVITWARLMPNGPRICLQAGHGEIADISHEKRLEHYGKLDQQWPFGLLVPTGCDAMEILYEHVPNHTHTVPYDILPVLSAVCWRLGWDFRGYGD